MLTLNYAKKVSNGYVMNFYADTEADVIGFNAAKDFMNYGKPVAGSVVTYTGTGEDTNYYLGADGSLAALPIAEDPSTPDANGGQE